MFFRLTTIFILGCSFLIFGCNSSMQNTMGNMSSVIGGGNNSDKGTKDTNIIDPGTPRGMVHAKLGRSPVSTYKTENDNNVEIYRYKNKSEFKEKVGNIAVNKAIIHGASILPGGGTVASLGRSIGEDTSESLAQETVIIKVEYEDDKVKTAKRIEE